MHTAEVKGGGAGRRPGVALAVGVEVINTIVLAMVRIVFGHCWRKNLIRVVDMR